MAKNSRFLESLVHDIPMYPFSSTPDGRIVAELHRGRRENKDFQEQSLAIQERAVERLIDIHKGAMAVPASDFRSSEAARILGDVAYEMQNVYAAQERSAQGIEALGQATSEGFDQVHEDLREIKGPTYPHEDLGELVESDQDFFAAMCAYSKGMLNQRAISQFHGVFTQKMKVRPSAIAAIETSLETNIREEQLRQIKETQRAQQKKGEKPAGPALPLPPLKSLKDFPEIREALKILKNPLLLLTKDRGATYQRLATLQQVAENYDVPLLKAAVDFFDSFFETYRKAQQTPLPQEMLIMLGKNHLLTPAVQHQAMKYFPETRDDASLTTVNYTLLDIARDTRAAIQQRKVLTAMGAASLKQQRGLYEQGEVAIQQRDTALGKMNTMIGQNETAREQRERGLYQGDVAIHQRDVTNYHLESIVGNLTEIKGGMVDFRGIVEDFAEMVEEGFVQVNNTLEVGFGIIEQRLDAVRIEMVLTRTAVVSELRKINESILYIGSGIIDSIERTNELLAELVDIARNSKQNEARQYFEDGSGCLKTAEEMDHIEEAYQRFCKGIDAHGMTVENHYGSALCAELLGRLEEAKKRYVTLIARCGKEKKELKSQGQEGLARVEYKSGNLPEAVNQCKEAQNTNPKNFSAKFSQAQYLALQGLWDEVVKVLVSLFQERSEWYLRLKATEVFSRFPELYHKKLLLELVDSKEMKGSPGKLSFLFDVMTLKMEDEAISLIMEKLETHPIEIMKNKPWKHPFFVKLKNKLFERIRSHLIENLDLLTAKTCYELTVVLSALGIEEKVLVAILQQGVNGDPQMYQDDCDKMEILRKEISEINSLETKKIEPIFSKINFPKKNNEVTRLLKIFFQKYMAMLDFLKKLGFNTTDCTGWQDIQRQLSAEKLELVKKFKEPKLILIPPINRESLIEIFDSNFNKSTCFAQSRVLVSEFSNFEDNEYWNNGDADKSLSWRVGVVEAEGYYRDDLLRQEWRRLPDISERVAEYERIGFDVISDIATYIMLVMLALSERELLNENGGTIINAKKHNKNNQIATAKYSHQYSSALERRLGYLMLETRHTSGLSYYDVRDLTLRPILWFG